MFDIIKYYDTIAKSKIDPKEKTKFLGELVLLGTYHETKSPYFEKAHQDFQSKMVIHHLSN